MNVFYNANNECLSVSSQDTYNLSNKSSKAAKFVCPVPDCQKVFRFKSDIQRHLPVHSNLRPHVCNYFPCTRAFKRVDALQDHIRSQHTHEAALACPYIGCGERFTTNAKLRYHTALHDTTKSHNCTVPGCEKAFVTLSQLKQHYKSLTAHRNLIVDADVNLKCQKFASNAQSSFEYSDSDETALNSTIYSTTKKIKSDVDSQDSVDCFFSFESIEQSPDYRSVEQVSQTQMVPSQSESDNNSCTIIHETLRAAVSENDILKTKLEMSNNATETLKQQLEQALTLLSQSAQATTAPINNIDLGYENQKLDFCDVDMHFNMDFDIGMNFDLFKDCLSRTNSYLL